MAAGRGGTGLFGKPCLRRAPVPQFVPQVRFGHGGGARFGVRVAVAVAVAVALQREMEPQGLVELGEECGRERAEPDTDPLHGD